MNRTIFWRVFWKEYRLQRAVWIAMAALTVLLMLLVVEFIRPQGGLRWLFPLALGLLACYGFGCGAVLFAGEHEAGTYEYQRALPVDARTVFAAKIAYALLSAAAMFGLTGSLAFWLGRGIPSAPGIAHEDFVVAPAIVGLWGLEAFLWATFFSLLSRRVVPAAILGVTAASFSMPVPAILTAVPLILVDLWLGHRWFRQQRERSGRPGAAVDAPAKAAFSNRLRGPGRMAILGRLLWQHSRQSLWTMVALCVPIVLLAAFPADVLQLPSGGFYGLNSFPKPLYLLALACVPLLGVCAFLSDQWGRGFRFLANRGVPPGYIWLSRQLVALAPAALVLPVLLCFTFFLAPEEWSPATLQIVRHPAVPLIYVFGYVVLSVAVGQLWSMFFRSSILAGVFSVISAAILAAWWGLMLFFGVKCWLWSVLPLPLAFLLATRLRTANWLLERNTWRAWLLPALALVVPVLAILTAVPLYRIYQIPALGPGFLFAKLAGPLTPEERSTLDLYRQQDAIYGQTKDPHVRQEAIALMLKASKRELHHPIEEGWRPLLDVADLLLINAEKIEKEGKLEAALEQYLAALRVSAQIRRCDLYGWAWELADDTDARTYARLSSWAARPGQAPERIMAAGRQLRGADSPLAPCDAVKLQYVFLRRVLHGDPAALNTIAADNGRPLSMLTMLWLRLPWERARALRLLNFETYCEIRGAWGDECGGVCMDEDSYRQVRDTQSWLAPLRKSELLYALRKQFDMPPISQPPGNREGWIGPVTLAKSFRAVETAREAARLVLALEAWKLQHGSLPKSLDELVGSYLDRLPSDPCSGQPFRYFPEGLKIPLHCNQPLWGCSVMGSRYDISANMPFIWSTGPSVRVSGSWSSEKDKDIRDEYIIEAPWPYSYEGVRYLRRPNSEYDVWESGWPFAIR